MRINRECFFGSSLLRKGFWCRNFENLAPEQESALPRYHECQFSSKTDSFNFFGPNLPKNGFRVENSESKCWNKNQYPRDTMCTNFQEKRATLTFLAQICPKVDFEVRVGISISKILNFEIFGLNLGKLLNLIRNFGSNNVKVVAESQVEAEMS